MQKLQAWKPDTDLNVAASDYVAAVKRLPQTVSLKEAVDFYLKRHPTDLPVKTTGEVVAELIESKIKSGKSDVYIKDLRLRLGQFANAFNVPLSIVSGKQIEDFLRAPRPCAPREARKNLAGCCPAGRKTISASSSTPCSSSPSNGIGHHTSSRAQSFGLHRMSHHTITPPFWRRCGIGCHWIQTQKIRSCQVLAFKKHRRWTAFLLLTNKIKTRIGQTSRHNAQWERTMSRCKHL
jgi:hypothetical protein